MKHSSLKKILLIVFKIIFIFGVIEVAHCQNTDTIRYTEVSRFKQPNLSLTGNCMVSYTGNHLFGLRRVSKDSTSIITIYKQNDTIHRVLPSNYWYCSIGTTVDGNPFLIEHNYEVLKTYHDRERICVYGIKKIYILDSLLNFTNDFNVKKNLIGSKCNEGLDDVFYHRLKYLRIENDCIILQPTPIMGAIPLCLSRAELEVNFLTSYPNMYDFGNNSFIEEKKRSIHIIQEGKVYRYDKGLKGNISPKLINYKLSFIKNGFATQLDNGDIVFYKFYLTPLTKL
ncbi:hypothetical protein [Bernardetia litoralis]|nr:hypothetical protein [Bernardetia litoralis]